MLDINDYKNLLGIVLSASLKGDQAIYVVELINKLNMQINKETFKPETTEPLSDLKEEVSKKLEKVL